MLLTLVSILIALASLGVSLRLAVRVRELERGLREAPAPAPLATNGAELPSPNPLEGLAVALEISQDHPHAVFANLLREQLLKEDCADVILGPGPGADLTVSGRIVCNGYSDVYFEADLACAASGTTLLALVEKPAGGDRPGNLALELVSKLKAKLEEVASRSERRQALRELGG